MMQVAVKQIRRAEKSYVPSIRSERLFLRELHNFVGLHKNHREQTTMAANDGSRKLFWNYWSGRLIGG